MGLILLVNNFEKYGLYLGIRVEPFVFDPHSYFQFARFKEGLQVPSIGLMLAPRVSVSQNLQSFQGINQIDILGIFTIIVVDFDVKIEDEKLQKLWRHECSISGSVCQLCVNEKRPTNEKCL